MRVRFIIRLGPKAKEGNVYRLVHSCECDEHVCESWIHVCMLHVCMNGLEVCTPLCHLGQTETKESAVCALIE